MSQYLDGAATPFSNCFFSFVYRYSGGAGSGGGEPKFTDTQKTTLMNIHRNHTEGSVVEKQRVLERLSNRFNIRKAGNFTFSVTIDAEQIQLDKINRAIQESTRYINVETSQTLIDVHLVALAATNIRDIPVKRVLQSCEFLFDFIYHDPQGFDEDFIRDNVINLDSSNPDIIQIVDIPLNRITQEAFTLREDNTLRIEFSLGSDSITPDEMRALTNAIDGFVDRGSISRAPPEQKRNWVGVG